MDKSRVKTQWQVQKLKGKGQGWNTEFNRKSFGEGQGRINAAIAFWYKICKKVIDNGHYLQ